MAKGYKFIDHGFDEAIKRAHMLDGAEVTVGFHGDDYYPDGTSVVDVAIWNNYGTRHIPARPFMDYAANANAEETKAVMAQQANQVYDGRDRPRHAMSEIGQYFRDTIQHSILYGPWVPNAPSTVRQKSHGQPLVDTERMFNSVDYKVDMT